MSGRRLIVLKFGGSVLRDGNSLRRAVHEIHRWRRDDYQVVAVVSALAGTTEELLRSCSLLADAPADHALAAVLAGGELQCASLLGLQLDRAGIPARVLSPGTIGLIAEGPALDAEPQCLHTRPIQVALEADEVVVVPGFVACDRLGRTVVLGRGGSDLTAIFLTSRLRASRCRLVKDVDGLYERDPAAAGPAPARLSSVAWDDALATDGSIVQHKALRFARASGLPFELGCANGVHPTLVGARRTLRDSELEARRPLRVALLGLGTVGGGVLELLQGLPNLFEVTTVLVRDPLRARSVKVAAGLLTSDASACLEGVDIVVEVMGGTTPALALVRRALQSGAHVVTANKTLVAAEGEALAELARVHGASFLHSAAVGGCAPLLERLAQFEGDVRGVRGILNGTVNFVLDGIAEGRELDEVLQDARGRGFAELDATRDLSGRDAADKLAVLAGSLGRALDAEAVECDALDATTRARAVRAVAAGRTLRQVSTLWIDGETTRAKVALQELAADDPLAGTPGEHNSAVIERHSGLTEIVRGKGAGRWPTAEALMGDLLQIGRERCLLPTAAAETGTRVSEGIGCAG